MKLLYRLFLFLVIWPMLLCPLPGPAQDYLPDVRHWGIEEGLSHRNVQCIHQDRRGFIWSGTKFGLNRFDGQHFEWYTKKDHGLQSNETNHILEDADGKLWLIYTGLFYRKHIQQIDIFDPVTERAVPVEQYFGKTMPWQVKDIRYFNQGPEGRLHFLTTDNRLFTYGPDGFHHVFLSLGPVEIIQSIDEGPNGWLWISYQTTETDNPRGEMVLQAFDQQGRIRREVRHEGYNGMTVYDLRADGSCRYLVKYMADTGGRNSFFQITPAGHNQPDDYIRRSVGQLKGFDPDQSSISHFDMLGDLLLIQGRRQPLRIVHLQEQTEIALPEDIPYVTDLLISREGYYWVASQFGIHRLTFERNYFRQLLQFPPDRAAPIRDIIADKRGRIWITQEDYTNLWHYDPGTADLQRVNDSESRQNRLPFPTYVIALHQGRNGDICYLSGGDLICFSPLDYSYTSSRVYEDRTDWTFTWSFYEDAEGQIWMGTGEGRIGFLDGRSFHWLPRLPDNQLFYNGVYQFMEDGEGRVWLATDNGLYTFDPSARRILEHYWSGGTGKYYLPYDKVYHIHQDEDGSFWLGTNGTGLVHWNRGEPFSDGQLFRQFTREDGLSNNTIYAVYGDRHGQLWMSSDFGLIRFDKEKLQSTTFLEQDGITHNEFNRISHYQTEDGTLYFGGMNGLTVFHPDDFADRPGLNEAPLVITGYQQYDENGNLLPNRQREIIESHRITLRPSDRFFRLQFELLTFEDTEQNSYAYMIEGVDQNWHSLQENSIRFSRLPYGNHRLRIRGQAANGRWSHHELLIDVYVVKPFYLRPGVLAASFLLLGLLIYGLYLWRVRSLKARQAELQAIVRERTRRITEDKATIEQQNETLARQARELKSLERLKSRFFANVSHELRTPLTLMLGPVSSLLKRHRGPGDERRMLEFIERNGRQLMKLINEILDLSKLENDKMEVREEPTHLFSFIQDRMAQFYSFAASEGLELGLDFRADRELTLLLDPDKVEKILFNFLSNGIKYTRAPGEVNVIVEQFDDQIQIRVSDTGAGIHTDDLPHIFDRFYQAKHGTAKVQGGTGIGLSLVREMAGLLGGEVGVESRQGAGSSFHFRFPLRKTEVVPESKAMPARPEKATAGKIDSAATLLVVEDNPELQQYLQLILSEYRILCADNGRRALDILQAPECPAVDLIISDLMMPELDGFGLLQAIKSDDRFRHLPFIMLTAKVNEASKLKALRIGVDDYVTKPFSEEELKVRLRNMLRNHRSRQQALAAEPPAGDSPAVVSQADLQWLQEVEDLVRRHLADDRLTTNFMAVEQNISVRQFHRRIKQLTGLTPNQYLQEIRLDRARSLLSEHRYNTIKEVAWAVGFRDAKYFSRLFRKQFGQSPSAFMES